MLASFGYDALIGIVVNLIFIGLSWWALQSIKLDRLLKPNRVLQARALYILLSIALGSIVSNFFLDYLQWSRQLPLIL
ncbi:DUF1146 family protein [Bacillus sp. CGMCC 1.16607]|uniref:DUF1146 family protein n=1 Tax=Bacillus sp. CGMCC 1.16607 TaxID=3351842 RepID=UPI003634BA94